MRCGEYLSDPDLGLAKKQSYIERTTVTFLEGNVLLNTCDLFVHLLCIPRNLLEADYVVLLDTWRIPSFRKVFPQHSKEKAQSFSACLYSSLSVTSDWKV